MNAILSSLIILFLSTTLSARLPVPVPRFNDSLPPTTYELRLIRMPGAGERLDGYLTKLNERSITVLQGNAQSALEIPVSAIDQLRFREKGSIKRGLLYGALIGFGAGLVFGIATTGSSSCTPGSAFCVRISPLAVGLFSGLVAAGGGIVIGGALGSIRIGIPIKGRQNEYQRQRQLLEQYRFLGR